MITIGRWLVFCILIGSIRTKHPVFDWTRDQLTDSFNNADKGLPSTRNNSIPIEDKKIDIYTGCKTNLLNTSKTCINITQDKSGPEPNLRLEFDHRSKTNKTVTTPKHTILKIPIKLNSLRKIKGGTFHLFDSRRFPILHKALVNLDKKLKDEQRRRKIQ